MAASLRAPTLVVPCFNEAERLDVRAFLAFADAHPHVHFLFVDDGSTDATRHVITDLAAERPDQFDVLGLDQNQGKAEAVRRGVLAALAHDEVDAVGFWDADLATPLTTIPDFIDTLATRPQIDIVLGARVKLLGRHIDRQLLRHYFGRVAATAASTLLGLPVYDTQCGAKLFRVTDGLRGLFADRFSTRWAFDVEILARWRGLCPDVGREEAGDHVVELPLQTWVDVAGSKLGPWDFLKTPIDLFTIWWRYRGVLRAARR